MKLCSLIFLSTLILSSQPVLALDFEGEKPERAGSSLAKSDTGDVALDLTTGDFDLNVDGEKSRLFFTASGSITHEALLGVVLTKTKKNGKRTKKYFTAEQARNKNICRKRKARGLYFFTQSVSGNEGLIFNPVADSDDEVIHFELAEIVGQDNLKRALKSYTSKKKSDVAKLKNDCSRKGGIDF